MYCIIINIILIKVMHVLRIDNAVRIMYTLRSNNCVLGLKSQFAIITCSHLKPVLRYIISMSFSASNNFIIVVTAIVLRVCVPVRSFFLPPRASRPRCTFSPRHRKLFYIIIIIVIFAENASFKSYGVICLPRMPLTSYSGATKYTTDTNRIYATWAWHYYSRF